MGGLGTNDQDAVCHLCEGQGMRVVEDEAGRRSAVPCTCRSDRKARHLLERARIPQWFEKAKLETMGAGEPAAHENSVGKALYLANEFANDYQLRHRREGKGLLFVGGNGVGKTHLGIAVLRRLIEMWDVRGIFYDYGDLLRTIMHSYSPQIASSEFEILKPLFECDVLMIDELGAFRPTEWVQDTVAHILNTRYSSGKTTILTTNFPNAPDIDRASLRNMTDAQLSARPQTLGERIGHGMYSRLQEMCYVIEMNGADLRTTTRRASLARL